MAKEKEIKSNIQDVIARYSNEQQNLLTQTVYNKKTIPGRETRFIKFLKAIYEVVRNEKTGNYAVKIYGATNAFVVTYCVIKSLITNK